LILNYLRIEHPFQNPLSASKRIKTVSKLRCSLACRLIFSKASRFICSYICEYFLKTFASRAI